MLVWTKKAEDDFRANYPGRKNKRKAGTVIIWEGKELRSGTILSGYKSRGWVFDTEKNNKKTGKYAAPPKRSPGNKTGHELKEDEKKDRWEKLRFFFAEPEHYSVGKVAKLLGYSTYKPVCLFVEKYGEELAAKYGKLPYVKGVKKPYWTKIMEAAQ